MDGMGQLKSYIYDRIERTCDRLIERHQTLKDPNTGQYGQDIELAMLLDDLTIHMSSLRRFELDSLPAEFRRQLKEFPDEPEADNP